MPPNPHIERLVPSIKGQTAMEHLHRYSIARDLCHGKAVLDLACGEGYGSALLAQTAHEVIGIDISEEAIANASSKYQRRNLRFVVGSATDLPLDSSSVDLVACFETIEHILDQAAMLAEIKRVLTPSGVLIISTPDKTQYGAADNLPPNPYHAKELTPDEFEELLGWYFGKVRVFGQRVTYASNILAEQSKDELSVRQFNYRGDYFECIAHEGLSRPQYLLALCSADKLPTMNVGLFEDREYSDFVVRSAREWLAREQAETEARPNLQIFAPKNGVFHKDYCSSVPLAKGRWCHLRCDLPWGLGDRSAGLRLDPSGEVGVIEIAGILVRSKRTRKVLWRAKGALQFSALTLSGTATVSPDERVFRILSFGIDPQVVLPILHGSEFDDPLALEAWMRCETSVEVIGKAIATLQGELQNSIEAKFTLEKRGFVLETRLHQAQQENEANRDKMAALGTENETMRRTLAAAQSASQAVRKELSTLRPELERAQHQLWDHKAYRADLTARLKDRDRWIQEVERSAAWKIIKPLWKLQRHFRQTPNEAVRLGELVFGLDGPGNWNASCDILTVKGWCFRRGAHQIVGVRAKIGRKSYLARYGIKREHVARTAPNYPPALESGFSVDIPVAQGVSSIRLEAIAQGNPWECFLEHPVPSTIEADGVPPSDAPRAEHIEPKPRNSKNGEYHVEASPLFPEIRADQVLDVLAPLIEQHRMRITDAKPFFTVITPTFKTLPRWLAEAGASLLTQTFPDWEWCLVDDGSPDEELPQLLKALTAAHPRFRVKLLTHGGISAACNQGVDFARGKFVCFLDHDDLLDEKALELMAVKLEDGFDVVYSDEDKLDDKLGNFVQPFFKPDFSPEYFRGAMYVGHLLCASRELASRVRFDSQLDGIQDFDFVLRLTETGARVGHIANVLYHWRKSPGSIAETHDAKPEITTLQQKAVSAHLNRLGLAASAEVGETPHRLKILPIPRENFPVISIVIPTKDAPDLLSRCLQSLYKNTVYPEFEALLVDNDTTNSEALAVMRRHPLIRRLYTADPFNFSRANNLAAQHARGQYLVFLNNDTEIIAPHWLDHLLYYAEQPDVGAAGALLLQQDGSVQHAGVVLGMRGTADHIMRGFPANSDGYAGALSCAREVSAVTAACMMIRKSLFEEVGGFCEHFFTIYQDVDLCLRLRERGLRIICTPQAKLLHHESLSRQKYYDLVDRNLLLDGWQDTISRGDPYYNENLNLERGDYSLRSKKL